MQWDEKELDTHFTQNVYFWTPNSEILAKFSLGGGGGGAGFCEVFSIYD